MSMKRELLFFAICMAVLYISFLLGCKYLDDRALFDVLFINFKLAPKSSFITLWLVAFAVLRLLYRVKRNRR